MAFLDNSGDIILDAVLTDTGRKRMARGDGTFRVMKFALGDDEINYGTYNGSAPAGQKDLQILQTPILEAFTNNTSMMHSYLQTYTNNTSHLYLPVMKLNQLAAGRTFNTQFKSYMVAVDKNTAIGLGTATTAAGTPGQWVPTQDGILYGFNPSQVKTGIRIDQGVDNALVSAAQGLPTSEFYENQYLIEMDSRFGQVIDVVGGTLANPSFIDDDQIASYYLSKNVNRNFITDNSNTSDVGEGTQVLAGARGTILQFQIQVTPNLNSNASWFTRLGGTFDAAKLGAGGAVPSYFIDTIVRVTGLTTGFRLDVPVRYVKAQGAWTLP